MVDQAIIDSVRNREEGAFKTMYENCIRYVYTIVRRYVTNESDHQDVIQEIFARTFVSIDSFDEKKGEFKFWLRRITINQCIKLYNKQKASVKIIPIDASIAMQSTQIDEINTFSRDEILQFITRMPSGYKQIFMLIVIDEFSHQEVGEMLNITPETSRSQFHRAKNWIRENLSDNNLKLLTGGI